MDNAIPIMRSIFAGDSIPWSALLSSSAMKKIPSSKRFWLIYESNSSARLLILLSDNWLRTLDPADMCTLNKEDVNYSRTS